MVACRGGAGPRAGRAAELPAPLTRSVSSLPQPPTPNNPGRMRGPARHGRNAARSSPRFPQRAPQRRSGTPSCRPDVVGRGRVQAGALHGVSSSGRRARTVLVATPNDASCMAQPSTTSREIKVTKCFKKGSNTFTKLGICTKHLHSFYTGKKKSSKNLM